MSKVAFTIVLADQKAGYANENVAGNLFSEHGFTSAGYYDTLLISQNNIQQLMMNAITRKMEQVFIYFYGPSNGLTLPLLNNPPLDVQFFEQLFTQFPKIKFTIILDTHDGSKEILEYFTQNKANIPALFTILGTNTHVKKPGFLQTFAEELNKLKTPHEKRKEAFNIFRQVTKGEVVSNHDGHFLADK
ncbi:predicted protein [Naegleria gruberi]|uniref:Predicted protein n=1 Tax=Naegleria gruberi TaxID=5762 RepID=D2W2J9_NAEGR|nr:uncharacterized protein NAEGRDRAFT_75613 [Naegleria gruberi]EFC36727.1 predicted protein [Naegleria gruberi]|eukprot:XP_002669471.1 predicted protein [Naegleria gruberi strain NEG-M]